MNYTKSYIKNYPRPSLVRNSFLLLDGEWKFKFDKDNKGLDELWFNGLMSNLNIQVPFAYSTEKSGIHESSRIDIVWYQKNISKINEKKHILHFEGADDHTMVWVNGIYIGDHIGGYDRFSFDITHALKFEENKIVVRVQDDFRTDKPRGKQRWKNENFGCWYHETTGIWKSVWLEYVNHTYIKDIVIKPDLDHLSTMIQIEINDFSPNLWIDIEIEFNDSLIQHVKKKILSKIESIEIPLLTEEDQFKIKTWSFDHPNLYDVFIRITENQLIIDEVASYFGIRKWQSINQGIYLNYQPVYLKMLLDQGYWEKSGLTPDGEDDLIKDILLTKEMGFNGIRKHQKIEDDRFYYFCDVFGLYVWLEMPSFYEFNDYAMSRFVDEWKEILKSHRHYPSIMTYVIFNESWGIGQVLNNKHQQKFTISLYHLTKSFDDTRFIISNDGWEHTKSDLITIHNYLPYKEDFERAYQDINAVLSQNLLSKDHPRLLFTEGFKYENQPIIISEYGGIAFESKDGWGYGKQVKTKDEFINRLTGLTEAIKGIQQVVGYCLTQTTDVEQEVNGLLTPNRELKIDIKHIQNINKK